MSMTTPRVTVPVEPEYTATEYLRLIAEGWEVIESTGSQMAIQNPEDDGPQELVIDVDLLSAAPAPEGGAVRYRHKKRGTEYTLIGVGRAQGELQDDDPVVLYRGDDGGLWVRHQVEFCDGRFEQVSALATREEAPAEDDARRKLIQCIEQWDGETEYDADDLTSLADSILHAFNGPPVVLRADPVQLSSNPCQLAVATSSEASPCPFCGCGMRVNYDPESEMYGPDGDHLPGCIIGNWDLHEYAFRPDALAAWNSRALRAQPPAREDAQPVAKVVRLGFSKGGISFTSAGNEADLPDGTPLFTHPAPDALRVAVEALVELSSVGMVGRARSIATEALAALQQEGR